MVSLSPVASSETLAGTLCGTAALCLFTARVAMRVPATTAPCQSADQLTRSGHVMCYGCLHQSMLAAIGRQNNPFPSNSRRGKKRNRGAFADLRAGGRYIPPDKWTKETLEEGWCASQEDRYRRQLIREGVPEEDISALLKYERDERVQNIQHPLEDLWNLGNDLWVIEGECPVCRKRIPGGLGPLEYRLGSVVLLETRVARAGEPEILSLA
ncbi:unnamed protein product [Cutaneotrichosporon oleaginosum]